MQEIVIMRKIQNCLGIMEKNTEFNGLQKISKCSWFQFIYRKYNGISEDLTF